MTNKKKCPECGAKMLDFINTCGDCGYNFNGSSKISLVRNQCEDCGNSRYREIPKIVALRYSFLPDRDISLCFECYSKRSYPQAKSYDELCKKFPDNNHNEREDTYNKFRRQSIKDAYSYRMSLFYTNKPPMEVKL